MKEVKAFWVLVDDFEHAIEKLGQVFIPVPDTVKIHQLFNGYHIEKVMVDGAIIGHRISNILDVMVFDGRQLALINGVAGHRRVVNAVLETMDIPDDKIRAWAEDGTVFIRVDGWVYSVDINLATHVDLGGRIIQVSKIEI